MGLQVWSRTDEKRGVVLALREDEVHRLEVTGNRVRQDMLQIMEALHHGREPDEVGAESVQTLRLATIGMARVSPDQDDVEFRTEGEDGTALRFSTSANNAGVIARSVLARTGRAFREEGENVAVVEAVVSPAVVGVVVGFLWVMLYVSAQQVASGRTIDVHGRRVGIERLFIAAAETLGVNGTLLLGGGVTLCIAGWAAMRVARRPQWTVWQVETAA